MTEEDCHCESAILYRVRRDKAGGSNLINHTDLSALHSFDWRKSGALLLLQITIYPFQYELQPLFPASR